MISLTTPAFISFLAGAEKITVDHITANYPRNAALIELKLVATEGKKNIHVVRTERCRKDNKIITSSSHCLIDRATGDVLKPAGYGRPAKGTRGNINDQHNGLGRMGEYGPHYNR